MDSIHLNAEWILHMSLANEWADDKGQIRLKLSAQQWKRGLKELDGDYMIGKDE